MKITAVSSSKGRDLIALYLDGEHWHEVHTSICGRTPRLELTGSASPEELFEKWLYKGAKQFLVRRLARQSYHSQQLQKVMRERLVPQNIIDDLLSQFCKLGYIDDENWLQGYVRYLQNQKCGPRAMALKLRAKGIAQLDIDRAVALCSSESHHGSIRRLLETRYQRYDLNDLRQRQKVIAALARKGFNFDTIFAVLPSKN